MLQYLINKVNSDEGAIILPSAEPANSEFIVNRRNVMRLHATGPYNFGLNCWICFFTKDKIGKSLLYQSSRSTRLVLDEEKVQRIKYLVEKRYHDRTD